MDFLCILCCLFLPEVILAWRREPEHEGEESSCAHLQHQMGQIPPSLSHYLAVPSWWADVWMCFQQQGRCVIVAGGRVRTLSLQSHLCIISVGLTPVVLQGEEEEYI